ncbi:VOC family protein [Sphingomonas profundi]|uniref:VOC family protein n=1 Tax=Alterirhizorhabdus profundi TaxID=2681549 RepID=UPI0012E7E2D5|nr:VOC family protein [Sphingomonas profundi]
MILDRLGPIIQNAFVVRDLDAAVTAWTKLGIGPFFAIHDSTYAVTRYRGAVGTADFSVAIGFWNDFQIELIVQRCDKPSVYREFLDDGQEGFHHVLTTTDDMDGLIVTLGEVGHELLADVDIGENGRVIYFRPAGQRWPLIEVGAFHPPIHALFDMMKEAARDWDGTDPLRVIG